MQTLIAEDLLLLLLDDDKGTLAQSDKIQPLLGGALMLELALVLGLFPRATWPAADRTHEAAVRTLLQGALVQGLSADQRTSALISLLAAIDHAHKVVERGDVPAKQVKSRAKEIADGDWAAKAVKDAVAAAQAAMMPAVMVSTTAATTGS